MADTERLDPPTEVNPATERRYGMPEADIERIQKALCLYVLRIGSAALAVMIVLGLVMGAVFWSWTADLRVAMSAQQARGVATDQQIAALDSDAVRRAQLESLSEKVKELEGTTFALRGSVTDIKRQQERLDSMIGLLSGNITALTTRVTEEAKAREHLIKAMESLGVRLDKR